MRVGSFLFRHRTWHGSNWCDRAFIDLGHDETNLRGAAPLGRIGQPDDIAHWVRAIINPQLQWASGMVLPVDGGLAHLRGMPRK